MLRSLVGSEMCIRDSNMATQKDLNAAFARGFRNQAAPMAAFTAGFDKVLDPVLKREEKEREIARKQKLQEEADAKQEKKRLDILAANSIGRVGANYNPEKVPNAMRASLENLLFTTKQNAGNLALQADAARQQFGVNSPEYIDAVSYTHLRAHETPEHLVCRLLLEKKK